MGETGEISCSPLTFSFLHIMRPCDGPHVRLNGSRDAVISEDILGFLGSVFTGLVVETWTSDPYFAANEMHGKDF